MNTTTQTSATDELREIMAEIKRRNGLEALKNTRDAIARAQDEMDRIIAGYEEATADDRRAWALNNAINLVATGILGNCRLDTLATIQADIQPRL